MLHNNNKDVGMFANMRRNNQNNEEYAYICKTNAV